MGKTNRPPITEQPRLEGLHGGTFGGEARRLLSTEASVSHKILCSGSHRSIVF
jgi:hypothetical protein